MSDAPLSSDERVELTPEQAIAMLPDGDVIHTFRNPGGMLLGADWNRTDIEREIREAERRELAGEVATNTGHGLVLFPPGAKCQRDLLFVATRETT